MGTNRRKAVKERCKRQRLERSAVRRQVAVASARLLGKTVTEYRNAKGKLIQIVIRQTENLCPTCHNDNTWGQVSMCRTCKGKGVIHGQ